MNIDKMTFSEPVTKERLKRYTRLKLKIDNQYERLERLTAALETPPKPMDGMPHSNFAVDRMAIGVARKIALEDAIRENLRKEAAEVVEIERAIQLVTDPVEQAILRLRYIDDKDWLTVSELIHYSESYTYVIHGRALISIYEASLSK